MAGNGQVADAYSTGDLDQWIADQVNTFTASIDEFCGHLGLGEHKYRHFHPSQVECVNSPGLSLSHFLFSVGSKSKQRELAVPWFTYNPHIADFPESETREDARQCVRRAWDRNADHADLFIIHRAIYLPGKADGPANVLAGIINRTTRRGERVEPHTSLPTNLSWEGLRQNPLWWIEDEVADKGQVTVVCFQNSRDDYVSKFYFCLPWHQVLFLCRAAPERHPAFGTALGDTHRQCPCNLNYGLVLDLAGPAPAIHCPLRENRGSDATILACRLRYFVPVPKTWKAGAWRPATWSAKKLRETRGGLEVSFEKPRAGLQLTRHLAKLENGGEPVYLSECVAAVILHSHKSGEVGQWGVTVAVDDTFAGFCPMATELRGIWGKQGLPAPELGRGRHGEVMFQAVVVSVFLNIEERWNDTLDVIEQIAGVTLSDFYDDKRIDEIMFDETLKRSRDYFTALQLLRIVDETIKYNVEQIKGIMDQGYETDDTLSSTMKIVEARSEKIQARVSRIKEELTSLRDGLFNATSLREATRGTSMNMTLYLFTIVTILFTPVSFLATYWALPWLNNPPKPDEDVTEPSEFLPTMLIVPGLTYAISAFFAWYLWPTKPGRLTLRRWLRAAWRGCKEFVVFIFQATSLTWYISLKILIWLTRDRFPTLCGWLERVADRSKDILGLHSKFGEL